MIPIKFLITVDDYGLSRELTDEILDCMDSGMLNNISIVPNGDVFNYAIKEYEKRKKNWYDEYVNLSIHLNLCEGKPLSKNLDMLVDDQGNFCHSFQSLWREYYINKEKLKVQIITELSAQIERVKKVTDILNINSHRHFHLMPFIFDILLELDEKYDFSYIRTINEPFIFRPRINMLKHLLLKYLSRREIHIPTSDYFIGVLATGNMSIPLVSKMLKKIPHYSLVEILFHKEFQILRNPVLKGILEWKGTTYGKRC